MKPRSRRAAAGLFLAALLTALVAWPHPTPGQARQAADQTLIARVKTRSLQDVARLAAQGLDLLEMREGDDLFIVTDAVQLEQLRRAGWDITVDETQTALLNAPKRLTFRDGYRTVAETRALLEARATAYPNLVEFFIYGSSWEKINSGGTAGHDLFGIRLTNRQRPGPKPTFFLMAAIHARELATAELALRLIDHLLNNYGTDGDATWLLDEHLIVVIPVVNPDGRVLAQQSLYQRKNTNTSYGGNCAVPPTSTNQHGVDLNRNYNFKWGTVNPPSTPLCAQTYPGPTAASEPETTAVANLVRALFPDQRGPGDTDAAPLDTTGVMLTLHSYSNLVLWPWGWTDGPAPNGASLERLGRRFAAYNNYTPIQSIQLYATSGTTDDWAYGELGIASFTFEVGPSSGTCGGFFPPFACLDGQAGGSFWPRNLPAFLYAARVARAPYRLAEGPTPDSATAGYLGNNQVELRARFTEQHNGNQNITAAEYYVDTPPWAGGTPVPMAAADGGFNGNDETAVVTLPDNGRHLIYVRARDADNNWGPVRAVYTPAATCDYTLTSASQSFAAAGGAGSVQVAATAGCGWAATSHAPWITLPSGNAGTGNGALAYQVAANLSNSPRAGTLTVGGETFTVYQGGNFLDVPTSHPFYAEIGKLSARGVTQGCDTGRFCPSEPVTRQQMAAFIIRALGDFNPPAPPTQRFADVPPANPFYNFIEQMAVRQITVGCGGGNYCPLEPVNRQSMAAFLIRALHEPGYLPPPPPSQRFLDVPPSNPFYAHIEELVVRGITQGCGGGNYCPADTVTRGQMAAFLVRAFNL